HMLSNTHTHSHIHMLSNTQSHTYTHTPLLSSPLLSAPFLSPSSSSAEIYDPSFQNNALDLCHLNGYSCHRVAVPLVPPASAHQPLYETGRISAVISPSESARERERARE